MIDDFSIIDKSSLPISIICNLQDSSQSGSHWVMCVLSNKDKIFYFSYGSPIS